jgi:hypothetical protein
LIIRENNANRSLEEAIQFEIIRISIINLKSGVNHERMIRQLKTCNFISSHENEFEFFMKLSEKRYSV